MPSEQVNRWWEVNRCSPDTHASVEEVPTQYNVCLLEYKGSRKPEIERVLLQYIVYLDVDGLRLAIVRVQCYILKESQGALLHLLASNDAAL